MEQEVENMETAQLIAELTVFHQKFMRNEMLTTDWWERHRKVEAEINKRIPRPELPEDR